VNRAVTIGLPLTLLAAAAGGGCSRELRELDAWLADPTCHRSTNTDFILAEHGSRPDRERRSFDETRMICTRTPR
jgi:hypothetical protein